MSMVRFAGYDPTELKILKYDLDVRSASRRVVNPIVKPARQSGSTLLCGHRPPEQIASVVMPILEREQITFPMIISHRRAGSLVRVRHEIWWTVQRVTSLSYLEMGMHFDRDHSSISFGIARHDGRIRGEAYVKPWIKRALKKAGHPMSAPPRFTEEEDVYLVRRYGDGSGDGVLIIAKEMGRSRDVVIQRVQKLAKRGRLVLRGKGRAATRPRKTSSSPTTACLDPAVAGAWLLYDLERSGEVPMNVTPSPTDPDERRGCFPVAAPMRSWCGSSMQAVVEN